MKKIILFILFISLASSLEAYSKRVVFASFSKKQNADNSLKIFQQTSNYKKLARLSKKYSFKIYTRSSGKYHIVVAEPIFKKSVAQVAYKIIKRNYKHAYLTGYSPPLNKEKTDQKKVVKKPTKQKEIRKKEVSKVVVKHKVAPITKVVQTKKEPIKEDANKSRVVVKKSFQKSADKEIKKDKVMTQKKALIDSSNNIIKKVKNLDLDIESILKYLSIFMIFLVLFYYGRKFKRIYDQY